MAASLILLPFVAKNLTIAKKDIPKVVLASLFAVTLNISFFFWGIKLTTALNASIIASTIPIFTLLFAKIFLKEAISAKLLLGGLLGVSGILFIVGKDFIEHGFSLYPLGDLLMLCATLSFVGDEIVTKKLTKTYNAFSITYYLFLIGALTFLPLAVVELIKNPLWMTHLTSVSLIGIGYGILFSSLAAYSLWEWGLSKIPASRVGFFFYLDPVVSTIAAVILLSEKITLPFLIGAAAIFLGIFIAEGRLPYHHMHHHIQKSGNK